MDTPTSRGFDDRCVTGGLWREAESPSAGGESVEPRVKRFYEASEQQAGPSASDLPSRSARSGIAGDGSGARIAVYDGLVAAPRVEELSADDIATAIEQLASRTYNLALQRGGTIPYTIIREIAENLIHAGFREVVVTILDEGHTIRFADQGPGIADKERVFLPGFSTATSDMKQVIRGVGSGLPIVRETLSFTGGTIEIEDNLGSGTVVTLREALPEQEPDTLIDSAPDVPVLTERQKQVLSIIVELGVVGPTVLSRELGVGVATAYRDLEFLERTGLIQADDAGRRSLTEYGITCLERVFG